MIDNEFLFGRQLSGAIGLINGTPRILVVDDDADLRDRLKHELIVAGYAVDDAENGARAWDAVQMNTYDLMVTDNDMPGLTGVELLAKLRTARIELPVIMITTAVPDQEFAKRPGLMPDAILLKPLVMDDFLEKVKTVLADGYHEKCIEPQRNWQNHAPLVSLGQ